MSSLYLRAVNLAAMRAIAGQISPPARCLVLLMALSVGLQSQSRTDQRSVVIGLSAYVADPGISVPKYSDKDADIVASWLSALGPGGVVKLQNQNASLDSVELALRRALLGARPGETVYIFLSGRGLARPGSKEGYIGTFRMVENKPQSTAVSVSAFGSMVENSDADAVYILADLCREPGSNRINQRLTDRLKQIKGKEIRGILASTGDDASQEDDRLRNRCVRICGCDRGGRTNAATFRFR